MMTAARSLARRVRDTLEARLAPTRATRRHELAYWRGRLQQEGTLGHGHYAWVYTTFFGLEPGWYADKRLLDVGCGPRGSLEWATMASERVGVDPLTDAYRALGTARHAMRYVQAPAERLPFPDAAFDVVSSFNALDHGRDARQAVAELARVCVLGGLILLLVEVNHAPTATEPVSLPWDLPSWFSPFGDLLSIRYYEVGPVHALYEALQREALYDPGDSTNRPAWLALKVLRRPGAYGRTTA